MADSLSFLRSIIPKNFPYIIEDIKDVDGEEKPSFCATIHLKTECSQDVQVWKEEFERLSRTSWIVNRTFPNIRRYQFKKSFSCRRSSHGKLKTTNDTRKEHMKLNVNCHSRLNFIIWKNTANTRQKHPYIEEGYLCVVKLIWQHSHKTGDDIDSLLKLKADSRVCEDFESYFEMGLNPSKARQYHMEMLRLNKPDFDQNITLNDSSLNPHMRVVIRLFEQWRQKKQHDMGDDCSPTLSQVSKVVSNEKSPKETFYRQKLANARQKVVSNFRKAVESVPLNPRTLAVLDRLNCLFESSSSSDFLSFMSDLASEASSSLVDSKKQIFDNVQVESKWEPEVKRKKRRYYRKSAPSDLEFKVIDRVKVPRILHVYPMYSRHYADFSSKNE